MKLGVTRYKMHLSYDGADFAGFQVQPNQRTIQGEIEKALQRMSKGEFIRIHGAGRTDAGVHAKGQVIHFDYPACLPADAMQRALNTLVTDEIVFWHSEIASNDFHAQYHAERKTYEYRVYNADLRDPFKRNRALLHPYPMDKEAMEEALAFLEGTHDFTSFSSAKTDKENKIRTIYEASVRYEAAEKEWVFTFSGDGFLYNMIRIIIGTVLPIADGRKKPQDMKRILEAKDRQSGGPTASPKGLCLVQVVYKKGFEN